MRNPIAANLQRREVTTDTIETAIDTVTLQNADVSTVSITVTIIYDRSPTSSQTATSRSSTIKSAQNQSPSTTTGSSSVSSTASTTTDAGVSSSPSPVSSTSSAGSTSGPSPNPSNSSSKSPPNCLSGGAVSGIVIGSAVIGAVIVLLLLFFMKSPHKRSRHHVTASLQGRSDHSSSRPPGHLSSALHRHPGNVEKGGLVERSVQETTSENTLEQPKDDATIRQSVAALFKAIEDHAMNYYLETPPRDATSHQEHKIQYNNLPSGVRAQADIDFKAILAAPEFRLSAITSLISAKVLDAIDFFGLPERSLLPESVTSFLRTSSTQVTDSYRSRLYLSRWRTSTAYLLGPEESAQHRARSQMVIDALIADCDAVVRPYVNNETDAGRRQHLLKVCKRAQELGLLLLSQPAEWKFDWSGGQQAERTAAQSRRSERAKKLFVVQPQLLRVTDNLARKLERPLVAIESQVLH